MKAVMYHYVRPDAEGYPHFRYLPKDRFRRQVEYFRDEFGLVSKEDFLAALESGEPPRGVVLTFDDGLQDHFRHVLPVLQELEAWGLFFVPTLPLTRNRVLDVHRIHFLLGRHGGERILEELGRHLEPDMLADNDRQAFHNNTYQRQTNDQATTEVKRILNYLVGYEHRENLLDRLEEAFPGTVPSCSELYLTCEQMARMAREGMILGSHSVSHRVFSKLSEAAQKKELQESFQVVSGCLPEDHPRCFCYPYGGRHTFTAVTERLLEEEGCRFSFCVDPRDILSADLRETPQALPRFDCNQFPHGQAAQG